MGIHTTIVFTDLHGSTSLFERVGNARATEVITEITRWISSQCVQGGGTVVKTLGDGVLAMFADPKQALDAVVEMQRAHSRRVEPIPVKFQLAMRIGVANGDVEMVSGDCYGDAVNVAARLCDMSGPAQIWVNDAAVTDMVPPAGVRFKDLGSIHVRGRNEPCKVYQVEWREDVGTEFMTMQAELESGELGNERDVLGREVELRWRNHTKYFHSFDLPIQLGRMRDAEFVVNDPRVSRVHARLEWRNGTVMCIDTSSYGSWVRFEGNMGSAILLRRDECVLHGKGELALGAAFSDESAPIVAFTVT